VREGEGGRVIEREKEKVKERGRVIVREKKKERGKVIVREKEKG